MVSLRVSEFVCLWFCRHVSEDAVCVFESVTFPSLCLRCCISEVVVFLVSLSELVVMFLNLLCSRFSCFLLLHFPFCHVSVFFWSRVCSISEPVVIFLKFFQFFIFYFYCRGVFCFVCLFVVVVLFLNLLLCF